MGTLNTGITLGASPTWSGQHTFLIGNIGIGSDVVLIREAAAVLAQRNSTTAQTFRIYATYTDASNYGRARLYFPNAAVFEIGTETAGTGTTNYLQFRAGDHMSFFVAGNGNAAFNIANAQARLSAEVCIGWGSSANAGSSDVDAGFRRSAAGVVKVTDGQGDNGAAMEFEEQTAPAEPAANHVRLYSQDNGSGKTQLMARFATGAAQQVAIEP